MFKLQSSSISKSQALKLNAFFPPLIFKLHGCFNQNPSVMLQVLEREGDHGYRVFFPFVSTPRPLEMLADLQTVANNVLRWSIIGPAM